MSSELVVLKIFESFSTQFTAGDFSWMNTPFMDVLITWTFEFFPTVFTNILPLKVNFYVLISVSVWLPLFVTYVAKYSLSLTDAWRLRWHLKDFGQIFHDLRFCWDLIILLRHFQMTEGTSLLLYIFMWQLTFILITWAWLYYPNEMLKKIYIISDTIK